jgi:hypothetical protein
MSQADYRNEKLEKGVGEKINENNFSTNDKTTSRHKK